MPDMHHEIEIAAPSKKVYEALTTSEGLRGWWTVDSQAEATVGSVAEFGFFNRETVFRMRIDRLRPRRRIIWTCLDGPEEWKGTVLTWALAPEGEGTKLHFKHGKWRSNKGAFAHCNSTWGALMYRLKAYAEGKEQGPHFT